MWNKPISINKSVIEEDMISPCLIRSQLFKGSTEYPAGTRFPSRYVKNYEIEYYLSGGGGMWINDTYYTVKKGDIIFRKPGEYTQATTPFDCYAIFFSMKDCSNFDKENYSINVETEYEDIYSNSILDRIPTYFHPISHDRYSDLFGSILDNYINSSPCSNLLIKSYILQIIAKIYQDSTSPLRHSTDREPPSLSAVKDTVRYIQDHFEDDLTLSTLSKRVNISPNYMNKLFHEIAGITLNDYIVKIRIEKSREMLIKTGCSISEIALECGFGSLSYFSYLFKRKMGISPIEFRRSHDLYK